MDFKLVSDYVPQGDQPQAIEQLVRGLNEGRDHQVLLGVTDGQVILVDEALTPDSSRFWPAAVYEPGHSQPSFDKQFVRDYLETLDWNKQPPGPVLPDEVVARTRDKYLEAYRLLTGRELEVNSQRSEIRGQRSE